jgi:hypothetical protein
LFIFFVATLLLNTIVAKRERAAIGLAVEFTGIPAYFISRRH